MTTMLEKMARRMAASVGNDPAWLRAEGYVATADDGVTVQFYDGVVKGEVNMLTAARAALLAIREDPEAIDALGAELDCWRAGDETLSTDGPKIMIDAILNEKPDGTT